jgi:DNA-binding GntR family transcriptional regulator
LAEIIEDFKEAHNALKERDAERCVRVLRRHVLDNVERIQRFMKPEAMEFAASQER